MNTKFPGATPEIPVSDMDEATAYYKKKLGFTVDWGGEKDGIAGISRGDCRLFLTNEVFRAHYGNTGPVLIWLNLDSTGEVDALHQVWTAAGTRMVAAPESKPWGLHEFTARDLDGNLIRVFYDFATAERDR